MRLIVQPIILPRICQYLDPEKYLFGSFRISFPFHVNSSVLFWYLTLLCVGISFYLLILVYFPLGMFLSEPFTSLTTLSGMLVTLVISYESTLIPLFAPFTLTEPGTVWTVYVCVIPFPSFNFIVSSPTQFTHF